MSIFIACQLRNANLKVLKLENLQKNLQTLSIFKTSMTYAEGNLQVLFYGEYIKRKVTICQLRNSQLRNSFYEKTRKDDVNSTCQLRND